MPKHYKLCLIVSEWGIHIKRSGQMSESIELGIVLTMAGGFMDAYSYLCRDHVFANAQTGNILLLGIYLFEHNWNMAIRYFFPILAFVSGIILSNIIKFKQNENLFFHWRQVCVLCEAIILIIVCFIPQSLNLLANSLTSLVCGIQVESFGIIHGNAIATTMCIGNLRSATRNMCEYFHTKNKETIQKAILYYGIILSFILGAILGNALIKQLKERAILICSGLLFVAFFMMFRKKEEKIYP